MKLKAIMTGLLLGSVALGATAQDEAGKENPWFVQGGLGASYSIGGGAGLGEMLSPAAQIAVGKQFMPQLGMRLAFGGFRGRYHIDQSTCKGFYHYNFVADGMWNISQTFSRSETRPVDVSFLLGVGYDRACKQGVNTLLVRTGAMMSVRLCKAIDFNVECTVNGVSDRWNTLDDHGVDMFLNLLAGVTYKFGTGYRCPGCRETVVFNNEAINEMRRETEVREVVVRDTVTIKEIVENNPVIRGLSSHVVFQLAKTNIEPSQEMNVIAVADYMKKYPESKATVVGYADKGTGSREINLRLAEERANIVADQLVNKYGISRDRLEVSWMQNQDTEQPFQINDWNRVVILTAD